MGGVIFSLPNYDPATYHGYMIMKELVSNAKEMGHKTYECLEESATQECVFENIKKAVTETRNRCFIGMGHGWTSFFTGHAGQKIFISCQQPPDALKVQVYLMYSCYTAVNLGPDFINKKVKAYWGWDAPAWVGYYNDPDSSWLQKALLITWTKFLSGTVTLKKCYDECIGIWKRKEEEYKNIDPALASIFRAQYTHCKLLGDGDIVFEAKTPVTLTALAPVITGVGAVLTASFLKEGKKK